jgi:cobalt-zinc-cadmium efflux system protein
MWMSLAVTVLFVVVEAWAGVRAHSLALLSDAGHNVSDAIALGLAAFAFWVARKPAAANRTFGYHRVAILTALFNALTLLVLAAMIAGGAVERFRHPTALSADGGALMIGVAAAAVLLNTVIAWALAGDAKHNLNSRAAYVHMAGDALSALGVVIAGVVVRTTGWTLADPLVSLLIAAFIAVTAVGIVRDASGILLENAPRGLDPEAVATAITSVSPVTGVHDLHVWTVGDGLNCLSCHIHLPGSLQLEECGIVVEEIHQRLHDEFGISHATIQAETENGACRRGADGDQLSYSLYCGLEPHLHDHGPDEHNHDEHSHDEHNHDVTTGSPAMPLGR